MLVATNRNTAGSGYSQLKAALERLAGTRISTNIVTGGKEIFRTFGLIESAEVVRETRDGRMQEVEIKLSDWVFNAIRSKEVLTLHRDYFRLRKPLERRIYELARKHCGAQKEWRISLALLQKKCGSNSTPREFRRLVVNIVREDREHDHMNLVYRDKLFPLPAYRRAFEGLVAQLPEKIACKITVELLALAHDRGCERELAEELDRVLDVAQLPDPVALRQQFGPDPSDLPRVTVQRVDLDSYDALVASAAWMGETA